jgi:hypothetical protein
MPVDAVRKETAFVQRFTGAGVKWLVSRAPRKS